MDDKVEELPIASQKTKVKLTIDRLKLASCLRLHPKFSWNSKSSQGLIHLIASVNFITETEDAVFKIKHEFDWKNVVEDRSYESMDRIEIVMENEIK
jgi:hypothetical protein